MCIFWFVLTVLMGAVLVNSSEDCPVTGANSFNVATQTLTIWCGGLPFDSLLLDKNLLQLPESTSPYEVRLESCEAYNATIAGVFNAQHVTLLRSLRIIDILDGAIPLPWTVTKLDNLLHLYLCRTAREVFERPSDRGSVRVNNNDLSDLIDTFHSLQTLHLSGVNLPMNLNSSISELSLEKIKIDQRIYCSNLRILTLRSVSVDTDYEYTFFAKPWLNNSALENVTIENVKKDLFKILMLLNKAESIRFLKINNCGLKQIWSEYNWLVHRVAVPDVVLKYFKGYESIQKINPFQYLLPKYLKELSLAHNRLSSFCFQDTLLYLPSGNERNENGSEKNCIRLHSAVNLLNLSHNVLTEVEFQDILKIGSKNIEIDFRGNPMDFIHFQDEEHTALAKRINEKDANITILLDSLINCKCHHGWLARAVRDFPSFVVTARCQDEVKTRLQEAPKERLECTESSCFPGCSCRRQWRGNVTTLRCKGLTSMPAVPNLHALLASSNQIAELRAEHLPDTLKLLDLSNNKLSQVDAIVAAKLFSVPKRRVWLAGNPFVCDCHTKHLPKALKEHMKQVLDYEKIECYNQSGLLQPVAEISVDGLCAALPETDTKSIIALVLSVIFTLLTALAIFVALYYRYKRSIKQYLYLRGCCMYCVTETNDEEDSEMLYDVFLSYSHKDEEFILQELLPGLEENQTHPYKVCVHFRDWIAGEFIPKQILQSVEQSRRTLILLSRNFVQSIWGLLEFRSALMSDVYESRSRLIVVVLDDVVSDPYLDPEIRNYVRSHTYVQWSDPQFWEKLRYVLPHRTNKVKKSKSSSKRNQRCNNASVMLTNFVQSNVPKVTYPVDYIQNK